MEERLIELESKLSFQEDGLQQLSDVLVKQQNRLDALSRLVGQLQEQLQDLAETQRGHGGESEKPPHY